MKIIFSQSAQDIGSVAVSLYSGKERLATVGIGETVEIDIDDTQSRLRVACGILRVEVETDASCTIEVSWSHASRGMIVAKDKAIVGEVTW